MEALNPTYRIFPLGDSAVTVDLGSQIDESINKLVLARCWQLERQPLPGMVEVVPAYSSLTIYYDCILLRKMVASGTTVFEWVKQQLEKMLSTSTDTTLNEERLIEIPVCYDESLAPDIATVAQEKNMSVEEVARIHSGNTYRVYMLGFLPGFSYMGETDERIMMPRKAQPSPVVAGSVGLAGRQTGIYPLASPGGWQIIGATPLKLFEIDKEEPCLLRAGDRVKFIPISKNEFTNH